MALHSESPGRFIARALLERAGSETAAAREVGDRLDGKPAQALVGGGDDENPIEVITTVKRVIVDPNADNPDGAGIPPAA